MKNYIIILVILLSMSSCFTERIDLDLNEENEKLVVTGWITDLNKPQYVTLSLTTNYLGEQSINYVLDAEVTLRDNVSSFSLSPKNDTTGTYFLPDTWTARVGDLYVLEVNYNGELYTASHVMRACPDIQDYTYELFEDAEEEGELYETVFAIQETLGEGDGYYAVDYEKGSLSGDSLSNGGYFDDYLVDGWFLEDLRVSREDRLYSKGEVVVIDLFSVGEKTVEYFSDVESEVFRGSPFDPPPTNVTTNISNGAVGYFIVSGAKQVEILIE